MFAERKAALIAIYPSEEQAAIAATLALVYEPIVKILQENAYREIVLRKRINEAAQAVMLAYATGSDLDQIGANYSVECLLVTAADTETVPPNATVYETDTDFRTSIQLVQESYISAGSKGSYVFHGLSASSLVKDI